jgi:hypothetical protein
MSDSTISVKELEVIIRSLGDVLRSAGSLEDFENWLKSQRGVKSVGTAEWLIKTEPPKKEVSVVFRMDDGSTTTSVIDVILYPDQTFGFAGIHGT